MSAVQIPKSQTVEALASTWSSLRELLGTLTPEQWHVPTVLPGWDVQANVAHILGTEASFLGEAAPEVTLSDAEVAHVRNDIGRFNEVWVKGLAEWSPERMLEVFDDFTARRLEALRSMTQEDWEAESMTPAGKGTLGRFIQIRVLDCWFHEQDIRQALARPGYASGPAVAVTLDEISTALGFVVGKRAQVPVGSSVTFELTGPAGRVVHVEVGERAQVVDALAGPATVTISMPVLVFTRFVGGRADAADHVEQVSISGDEALGRRVVESLGYMI